MTDHIFTGFGFGPIQGGLFVKEAFQSRNFARIVIAEIDATLVQAVRAAEGSYCVNIAAADAIETVRIDNVELLNPTDPHDRDQLIDALSQSTEIATSLPSVDFFEAGGDSSVASLIARGIEQSSAPALIIYTAENNNHAAEALQSSIASRVDNLADKPVRFLNTVIGKMSRVVTDRAEIEELALEPIAPGIDRAFLVEQFNHILVTRTALTDFRPGIEVFVEKDDLLPFEHAKLFGHNAVHALLAYLGAVKGYASMTQLKSDTTLMQIGRDAFLTENGAALIEEYAHLDDELFTEAGYRCYAEDLLDRMTNPYLADTTARAGRDIIRKLRPDGRIFGTMDLVLDHGIEPRNMALGAIAAIACLLAEPDLYELPADLRSNLRRQLTRDQIHSLLRHIWAGNAPKHAERIIDLTAAAKIP